MENQRNETIVDIPASNHPDTLTGGNFKRTYSHDAGSIFLTEDDLVFSGPSKSNALQSCCYCFWDTCGARGDTVEETKFETPALSKAAAETSAKDDISTESGYVDDVTVKNLPLTFVPNFIIDLLLTDPEPFKSVPLKLKSYAALLVVDVCGFTPLTEGYCRKQMQDDLAADLNDYMSQLASTLMSFGGDILNFAGDAYLVMWEGKSESNLPELAEQAFKCAVCIQSLYSTTDISKRIKVKIGIATGEVALHIMGSPSEFLLFVISGDLTLTVRMAEELCSPGEIVISEDLYQYLKMRDVEYYDTIFLSHGFLRVTGFPRGICDELVLGVNENTRLKLFQQCNIQHVALIRSFLIPILRDIRTADQLMYLSEVTKITILFILLPDINVGNPKNLSEVLETIMSGVKDRGGVLNKVLLFDKGCTFLAVFGLPGLKHLNDAARAVVSADAIIREIGHKFGLKVATGISSGTCFCGMIGHAQRQEYTVIGSRVNMACRLMTTYPDFFVVLDADSYHLCRQELGSANFIELEKRTLKGIKHAPTVYAYRPAGTAERRSSLKSHTSNAVTCVDQMGEEKLQSIERMLTSMKDIENLEDLWDNSILPFMLIEGSNGSGKSFLLYFSTVIAHMQNYQYFACSVHPFSIPVPFATISKLLKTFFSILSRNMTSKEAVVLKFLENTKDPCAFLLNHLLDVKFPIFQNTVMQAELINVQIERLLFEILSKICKCGPLLIAIDDAEYMDPFSWRILRKLASSSHVVVIVTYNKCLMSRGPDAAVVQNKGYEKLSLKGFDKEWLTVLLSWFYGVSGVHRDIVHYLKEKARKDSRLIEELLLNSDFLSAVRIKALEDMDQRERRSIKMCKQSLLLFQNEGESRPMILTIREGTKLPSLPYMYSFSDAVKERLNTLKLQERLVLKRAAVLGFSFRRYALDIANPGISSEKLTKIVQNLILQNVLCIKPGTDSESDSSMTSCKHPTVVKVDTRFGYIATKVPCYYRSQCPLMINAFQELQFCSLYFHSCVLEQMTKEQKIKMRIEIARELEQSGLSCHFCKQDTEDFQRKCSSPVKSKQSWISACIHCNKQHLQVPPFDLRKCSCLKIMIDMYQMIATMFDSAGHILNAVRYWVKAAEACIYAENPIMVFVYADFCEKLMPGDAIINFHEICEEEVHISVPVLKGSLFRVKSQAFLLLNNVYNAASYAMKGIQAGGLDASEFIANIKIHIISDVHRMSKERCKEIARCFSLLCETYSMTGKASIACRMAEFVQKIYQLHSGSFVETICAKILVYRCSILKSPLTGAPETQDEIIKLCHRRLTVPFSPLNWLEIRFLARAYKEVILYNLSQNNITIVEDACREVFSILSYVRETSELTTILAYAVQACVLGQKHDRILTFLNHLRQLCIESGNLVYLGVFYCGIIELYSSRQRSVAFADRVKECNQFIESDFPDRTFLEPSDVRFYIAAKITLWLLEARMIKDKGKSAPFYVKWFKLAETLRQGKSLSFWYIGGELMMIKIYIIIDFCIKNLDESEIKEALTRAEQRLVDISNNVKAYHPVFSSMLENLIADLIYLHEEFEEKGTWKSKVLDFLKPTYTIQHVMFISF